MASIYQSIEILSKEKGIDPQIVMDAVKEAMLVAARKHFKTTEELAAEFDQASGELQIFAVKKIVEEAADPAHEISLSDAKKIDASAEVGGEVRFPKKAEGLSRVSAQTFKQVILQKLREAERDTIFTEYAHRVGELVTCVVKRIEGPDLVLDMGKTEARLPKKEQSRLENFSIGDRVRCIIKSVEKSGKNAGVILSRADADFVKRLFEQEVPEIYDNTVVIKACAREAGERTKIAVFSRDRDVDCVGACVGMKGMRVQSIIRELRSEKIDIIEYSEDPIVFATHALSPAKISRVTIVNATDRHMEVIVEDTQLSLAIGKKGQNVRLAAKLIGWKVDIKSEEEKRQEVETAMSAMIVPGAPVSVLMEHGLAAEVIEKLVEADIGTVEKLGYMTPEDLEALPGIEPQMVDAIQQAVNGYYSQFEEPIVEIPAEIPVAEVSDAEVPAAEVPAAEAPAAEVHLETPAPASVEAVAENEINAAKPAVEVMDHTPAAEKSAEGTEGVQS